MRRVLLKNHKHLTFTKHRTLSHSCTLNQTSTIGQPQDSSILSETLSEASLTNYHQTFSEAGLTTLSREGVSQFYPTGIIEHIYQQVIENYEISWLFGIPLVTVLIRSAILPVQINNQRKLKTEMYESQKKQMQLRSDQVFELNPHRKAEIELEINHEKINMANPTKMILRMLPTGLVMSSHFIGLRNIASSDLESINSTFLPWAEYSQKLDLPSLALSDPLFILPATASFLIVYTIAKGFDESLQNMPVQNQKLMAKFGQVIGFITFCLVASQSATVSIMFATNATISVIVGKAMKSESVQKSLGMYKDPEEQKRLTEFMKLEFERQLSQIQEANRAREQTKIYEDLAKKKIKERAKESDWK